MRLIQMSVRNFRSIKGEQTDISFSDSDIIFLFGQNNTGKSSILDAYEFLVKPKAVLLQTDFHGFEVREPVEIEAAFQKDPGDNADFEKKGLNKWVDDRGVIRFRKRWTEAGAQGKKETWDPMKKEFVDNGFGGLESHFKSHAPQPIRIPAMPAPDELSKWASSTVKNLVLKQLRTVEEKAYNEVLEKVADLQERVMSNESIAALSDHANLQFQRVFPDLTMAICPAAGSEVDISKAIEKEFSVTISDPRFRGVNQGFSHHGHGVIRQAMFNFLGIVGSIIDGRLSPEAFHGKSDRKTYLILFEEPEVYLHPKAIKLLRSALYELCDDSPFQILCTSHSPALIDISKPHTSLVRVVRRADGTTAFHQVGHDLFASSEERKKQVQMINRFNPHVCESFFADEVIAVEGDTEAIVFRELLERRAPKKDIFVLNSGTKNNLPFFQEIFTHFRIKHHVVHDSDTRYCYSREGDVLKNSDGTPKKNPAWALNKKVWLHVSEANALEPDLANRHLFIRNFEDAHNYEHDTTKGKPLSAFEFVETLACDGSGATDVEQIVEHILGNAAKPIDWTPEDIEEAVREPLDGAPAQPR